MAKMEFDLLLSEGGYDNPFDGVCATTVSERMFIHSNKPTTSLPWNTIICHDVRKTGLGVIVPLAELC